MRDVAVKTVSRVAEVAEEQLAGMSERLNEAAEAATDFVHETKRAVKRELRQGWERVEDATIEIERYIRRHPFKATLIALGAGLGTGAVVGWLVSRSLSNRK